MLRYPFKAKIIIIKLERESNSLKKDLQSYTLPVCYLIKTFGILLKYNFNVFYLKYYLNLMR